MVNDDLLIGRVYLGDFPNGTRVFTFPMTRKYGFEQMSVPDHEELFDAGTVPTKEALERRLAHGYGEQQQPPGLGRVSGSST